MIQTLVLIFTVVISANVVLYGLNIKSWPEEQQDQQWWGD